MSNTVKTMKKEPTLAEIANAAAAQKKAQLADSANKSADAMTAEQKLAALRQNAALLGECLKALSEPCVTDKDGRFLEVTESGNDKALFIKVAYRNAEEQANAASDPDIASTSKYVTNLNLPLIYFVVRKREDKQIEVKIFDVIERGGIKNTPFNPVGFASEKKCLQALAQFCGRNAPDDRREAMNKIFDEIQKKIPADAPAAPVAKPK